VVMQAVPQPEPNRNLRIKRLIAERKCNSILALRGVLQKSRSAISISLRFHNQYPNTLLKRLQSHRHIRRWSAHRRI
jgi:hypothetical protein